MWSELKRAVHKRKPEDMKDLERFCMEQWSKVPPNVFSNIIEIGSVPLSLAAPSTKNRGANDCETSFLKRNV